MREIAGKRLMSAIEHFLGRSRIPCTTSAGCEQGGTPAWIGKHAGLAVAIFELLPPARERAVLGFDHCFDVASCFLVILAKGIWINHGATLPRSPFCFLKVVGRTKSE